MATRGRKPKPATLRLLEGNRGHRDIPPEPKAFGRLEPPDFLGEIAAAKWRELAPELERTMGAGKIDSDALAAYCFAWQAFVDLRDASPTLFNDKGNAYRNPDAVARNEAMMQIRRFGAVLGLSPSDRVGKGQPTKDDNDPAAEFVA